MKIKIKKLSNNVRNIDWDAEPDIDQLRRSHELLSTDPVRAINELEQLAQLGSTMSILYIAHAYRTGIQGKPDLEKAEYWLLQDTNAGYTKSAYSLALVFRKQKKYLEAIKLCKGELLNSFAPALYLLGVMYKNGEGVSKNLRITRDCWENGASLGHLFSKRDLAFLLISGQFGFFQMARGVWIWLAALIEMPLVAFRNPSSDRLSGIEEPAA
jgi:TPR repeat protein